MKKIILISLVGVSGLAAADPSISVFTSLAPNAFGSPSWTTWVSNSNHAIENGLSSYGTAGDPTQYSQVTSPISRSSAIVTGFNSWLGVANPGSPYGSELGNRMTFGVHILGNGTQFSISQISFVGTSTGDGGGLDFSNAEGVYGYSNDYEGINYGADHIKGTADDFLVTGGSNTQLVDELVGRGSGNSYAAYSDPSMTNQQEIDAAANDPTAQWDMFSGAYSLDLGGGSVTGSAAFQAVPEPTTIAALGLGAILLIRRRRKSA